MVNIIEHKLPEVRELYSSGNAERYMKMAKDMPLTDGFFHAITKQAGHGLNLIAEFKRKSPMKGWIRQYAEPEEIAKLYEECGASAISVLTDSYFDGKLEHLKSVRETVRLPILRKDFIIDPDQIYESRVYGADAILLIAALLETKRLKDYIQIAESLGMECLVESRNEKDLEKAVEAGAKIFGINNRNWDDGSIDTSTTLRLLPYVPEGKPVVTESGILSYEDVKKFHDTRVNAMLVGEGIMSEELNPTLHDMKNKIYELIDRA